MKRRAQAVQILILAAANTFQRHLVLVAPWMLILP
jgi:hypothetical protein